VNFLSLDINIYWEMSYCQYQCFSLFFLLCVGPLGCRISDYATGKGKNNKLAEACLSERGFKCQIFCKYQYFV